MRSKKILLIGGCGYIGSTLYQSLINRYEVDSVDMELYGNFGVTNRILDYKYVEFSNTLNIEKYDAVILLAGNSSVKNSTNIISTLKNNVLNFCHLLNALDRDQIFIYASSSSVYGVNRLANEDCLLRTPQNYYDLSKQEIDNYAAISDRWYYGLRFGTVNGFSINFRTDVMINSMFSSAVENNKVTVSNPEIMRPILGISDLCKAIKIILEKATYDNRGIYNLHSFNTTVEDVAKLFKEKENCEIEYSDVMKTGYDFSIDSTKFKKTFDFDFSETPQSIIQDLYMNLGSMNFTKRDKDVYRG